MIENNVIMVEFNGKFHVATRNIATEDRYRIIATMQSEAACRRIVDALHSHELAHAQAHAQYKERATPSAAIDRAAENLWGVTGGPGRGKSQIIKDIPGIRTTKMKKPRRKKGDMLGFQKKGD